MQEDELKKREEPEANSDDRRVQEETNPKKPNESTPASEDRALQDRERPEDPNASQSELEVAEEQATSFDNEAEARQMVSARKVCS